MSGIDTPESGLSTPEPCNNTHRYIVTTWVLGRPDPMVTYSTGYWPFFGLLEPGIYQADGLTVCVKRNPDYAE